VRAVRAYLHLAALVIFAPTLAPAAESEARSYDCAAEDSAPGGDWHLTQPQFEQFLDDWHKHDEWSAFMPRTCGTIENGQQMIMTGALHIVGDYALCDDDANFAIFYDPKTRTFGDVIPHQKLCANGQKIPRPHR